MGELSAQPDQRRVTRNIVSRLKDRDHGNAMSEKRRRAPPLSPVLFAGFALRPLPTAILQPFLSRAMGVMHRRHRDVFGRMDSLRVSQLTLLTANTGTNERRVMLAGNIGAGVVLRFWIPERGDLAGYSVVLEQVATRAIYVQQPLDGYSLSVIVN